MHEMEGVKLITDTVFVALCFVQRKSTIDGVAPTSQQLEAFQQFGAFDTQFDIFLVASDGFLYFGPPQLDGNIEANRPVTLDTSRFYTR